MRYDSTTGPTPNHHAIACRGARFGKGDEIAERNRRFVPAIKSQNRGSPAAEEDLVNRHIERPGARHRIVNDNQFIKERIRFLQEFALLQSWDQARM